MTPRFMYPSLDTEERRAKELAAMLEAHWLRRGFRVRAWAEKVEIGAHTIRSGAMAGYEKIEHTWTVRSTLKNGRPT